MSKRDAILKATRDLLWEQGYEATSPRQILDRSEAGQGSLYHHFGGKKELAIEALNQVEASMSAALERLFDGRGSVVEHIERFLDHNRNGLQGCPLGRMAAGASIRDPQLREPVARYFRRVQRTVAEALRTADSSGEINLRGDPNEIAAALLASVQGGYTLSRINNDGKYLRMAIEGALAMFRQVVVRRHPVELGRFALPVVTLGI